MVSDKDLTMNHKDQAAIRSRMEDADRAEPPWAYGDFTGAGDLPADLATGLVSLAFIRAALGRGMRVWLVTAIIGLLAGLGLYAARPPAYQASATVVLTLGPYENANNVPTDNQAIAQSRAVAGLATRMLKLNQDPGILLAEYTTTIISPDVLRFAVTASSPDVAVSRANAVAAAFLRFRADQLEKEQNLAVGLANQQVSQAQQKLNAINKRISLLSAQPASTAKQAKLSKLQTQRDQAAAALSALQQSGNGSRTGAATALAVKKSQILDNATLTYQSRLKRLLPRPAVGFVLGLVLGMGFVVIRALSSDKLRRRDDVARALGAPVQLSVGPVPEGGLLRRKRGLAAADTASVRRIVTHLSGMLPASSRGPAALAVVPVGDPGAAALAVASLALSYAQQGNRVAVADLVSGAPAGRLLDGGQPGVRTVHMHGVELTLAVPEPEEVALIGPFSRAQRSSFSDEVAAGCASANLLLTLTALDPSLGADYLRTWAASAVAVVTAGESSWTQIHAAGQMLRMAGVPPISAVLIGADKHDESLGRTVSTGIAAATSPWPGSSTR
jgi:hypothetical protein